MCLINPLLYFSPQVENKPYELIGKYAFILENSALTTDKSNSIYFFLTVSNNSEMTYKKFRFSNF
jgi:hypothetical protein